MHYAEDLLTTPDGATMALAEWTPAAASRGTVVIAHGLGEHGGRYRELASDLTSSGWTVRATDHRGHGRSHGARGAIPAPDAMQHDILWSLRLARAAATGPVVLLGHSMGGAFAAAVVAQHPDAADGLILSSPALLTDLSVVQRMLMTSMRRIAPNLAVGNGLNADFLSHDRDVVAAYKADPLVHDRVSARLAHSIMSAGAAAREAAPRWSTPTLLLYAGADRLVNPQGSEEFASAAPPFVVTSHRFADLYHEIFNERDRDEPVRVMLDWLRTMH